MATEKQEHKATQHALDAIANWMKPPTGNEGINYAIARLGAFPTDRESFIGGGDTSIFTPSGHRGILTSSLPGEAVFFDGTQFPIVFTFDLNSGTANGTWTNPATAAVETVSIKLELNRIAHNATFGKYYIFNSDNPVDEMGYLVTFTLL
jgi:hypothetical protein